MYSYLKIFALSNTKTSPKSNLLTEETVHPPYSMVAISKSMLHWLQGGIKTVATQPLQALTIALLAQAYLVKAAATSTPPSTCSSDLSPLDHSWQMQCPAHPPTKAFVTEKHVIKLNALTENYIIYSNYPLTHVQLFIFGGEHNGPFDKLVSAHPNEKLFSSTLIRAGRQGERVLIEGLGFEYQAPCANWASQGLEGWLPATNKLICQGWEISTLHSDTLKPAEKIHTLEQSNRQEAEQFAHELSSLQYRLDNLSFKNMAFMLLNSIDFFDLMTSLDEEHAIIKSKITRLDDNLKAATEANEVFKKISIAPRNEGMIKTIDNALVAHPHKRIWVRGGTYHFFNKDSMTRYNSSDGIAPLRQHLEKLESRGIPTALLYSRKDKFAAAYANDLGEKKQDVKKRSRPG